MTLDTLIRIEVSKTLGQCRGNINEACKFLGVSRATLYRYMKKYHLNRKGLRID